MIIILLNNKYVEYGGFITADKKFKSNKMSINDKTATFCPESNLGSLDQQPDMLTSRPRQPPWSIH